MRCLICGCTDNRPCPAGCGWSDIPQVCTVCAALVRTLCAYIEEANRVTFGSLGRALTEARRLDAEAAAQLQRLQRSRRLKRR